MGAHRSVQRLLDRLVALDDAIDRHRRELERADLTDGERESNRVSAAMHAIERAKTVTQLRAAGWRGGPMQPGLFP